MHLEKRILGGEFECRIIPQSKSSGNLALIQKRLPESHFQVGDLVIEKNVSVRQNTRLAPLFRNHNSGE